jgi:two-component system, response regulator PdtaR
MYAFITESIVIYPIDMANLYNRDRPLVAAFPVALFFTAKVIAMQRVLIAEDEQTLAFLLQRRLESKGYQVVGTAENGRDAVKLCRKQQPDVVLMDVDMPYMNGIEATRRIMRQRPTCVVVVSGSGQHDAATLARDAGAMAYLTKPVEDTQLFTTIQEARKEFVSVHSGI